MKMASKRPEQNQRKPGWFDKIANFVKFDENRQIVLKRVWGLIKVFGVYTRWNRGFDRFWVKNGSKMGPVVCLGPV
jgi:hypothetical protein